jgi:hypothetical protein
MVVWYDATNVPLHYWTPLGVPYEMIVKDANQTLQPKEVYSAFEALLEKMPAVESVVAV